ncbi:hypothetical protein B7494_g7509 [Chlorociboria aeruginascens]|nr:hypothetical protein B7494_g7509 [Chlorociboria aeruginascens]
MAEDLQQPRKKLPSGLHLALNSLGRISGSSATPAPIVSPVPNRNISSQVANMNRSHHSNYSGSNFFRDKPSQSRGIGQNQKTTRGSSRDSNMPTSQDHHHSLSMGGTADDLGVHPSDGSSYDSQALRTHSKPISGKTRVNLSLVSFEQEVRSLKHLCARTSGVPKNVVDTLGAQASRLEGYFIEHQNIVRAEFDELEDELKHVTTERDNLQKMCQKHGLPQVKRVTELDRITASLSQSMELAEKQPAWQKNHTSSVPYLDAASGSYDQYVAGQHESYGGYSKSGYSPAKQGPVFKGPPKLRNTDSNSNRLLNARRPNISANLQSGYQHSTQGDPVNAANLFHLDQQMQKQQNPRDITLANLKPKIPMTTEPGNDLGGRFDRAPSSALVLAKAPSSSANAMTSRVDNLAPEFQSAFARVYRLIDGFVTSYTIVPNYEGDRAFASSNGPAWKSMLDVLYPGQIQDSHTHAMALLGDPATRPRYMMRVVVGYCVSNIMNIDNWYGFSLGIDTTLDEVKQAQEERGLLGAALQRLVERKTRCVQKILDSSDCEKFRSASMTRHTKALRSLVGPMLDRAADRTRAGKDLGAIANACWDLSIKMFTCNMTFLCTFPLTNGKFQSATMNVLDLPDANPLELQIQQARLKLVITPVVVMRDDNRIPIAKDIQKANVLIMR